MSRRYCSSGHPVRDESGRQHYLCRVCFLLGLSSQDITTTAQFGAGYKGACLRRTQLAPGEPDMVDLGDERLDFRNNWETTSYHVNNPGGPRFDLMTLERRGRAEAFERLSMTTIITVMDWRDPLPELRIVREHLAGQAIQHQHHDDATMRLGLGLGIRADDYMDRRYGAWRLSNWGRGWIPSVLSYSSPSHYCPETGRPLRARFLRASEDVAA